MDARLNHLGQPVGVDLPGWRGVDRPDRTVMEGQYCRVEPLDMAKHGGDLFDAFNEDTEGRIWTYLAVGPFADRASFDAWLSTASESTDPLFHAIVDRVSGLALGVASFMRIDKASGVIEVGNINYSPRLQRSRVATDAMFVMMRRVFEELGYRRYEWKCDSFNAGSRSAAVRLGFQYEGLFRQAVIYKGRSRDTAWFSIVDREWPALKSAYDVWLSPDNFDQAGAQRQSLSSLIARLRD